MYKSKIPFFYQPCIDRLQADCPHLHTSFYGGRHFSGGEVWDYIHEVCDDCGVNLNELDRSPQTIPVITTNPLF